MRFTRTTITKIVLPIPLALLFNSCYAEDVTNFFSCTTENQKKIQLLGFKESDEKETSIKYVLENNNETEFFYPDTPDNSLFTYHRYFRYQTEYFRLFFKNYSFEYMLYRNYSHETTNAGIYVTDTRTGEEHNIPCSTIEYDNLKDIEDIVQEDEEGRL